MVTACNDKNEKVASYDAIKGEKYYCPACGNEVILRQGKTNIPHFSHKNLLECDISPSQMSDWHINWQNRFPIANREIVIKHVFEQEDVITRENNLAIGKEYFHRADVCINNYVIEFQHSSITKKEFDLRNYFYAQSGYKVIWIFDLRDEYESRRLKCYDEWNKNGDNGGKWKWNNPPRFLSSISPQRNKSVKIFIQFSDENDYSGYIELIIWAPDSKIDYSKTDYRRFFTSYSITNFDELYDSLANNII